MGDAYQQEQVVAAFKNIPASEKQNTDTDTPTNTNNVPRAP